MFLALSTTQSSKKIS